MGVNLVLQHRVTGSCQVAVDDLFARPGSKKLLLGSTQCRRSDGGTGLG